MTTHNHRPTSPWRRLAAPMAPLAMTLAVLGCTAGSLPTQRPSATVPPVTETPKPANTSATVSTPTATSAVAGPWVAYQGPEGLRLVRLDGTSDHLFPSVHAAQARHPDWSPDGNWL